ncbi:hypothetical protein D3C75_341740 [compost metagenome]
MPGYVDDAQRGHQQGDHGEQGDFKEQRQRNRQAQLYQALNHRHIRLAESGLIANIAHRPGALHVGEHAEEHHPVHCSRRHAAANAAQLRHAKVTVNKDVVHRNIDQQPDKAHHHTRFGFRQTFALITCYLEE